MLIANEEALERLSSPMNLMNRLRAERPERSNGMTLFGVGGGERFTKPVFKNPFESLKESHERVEEGSKAIAVRTAEKIKDDTIIPEGEAEKAKEPTLDDLVANSDTQIKLAQAHDDALRVLGNALTTLDSKLDDIKPEKLPSVIAAASKVVDQIQRQRMDASKNGGNKSVHLHFYTPTPRKVDEYEVVEVG